VDEKIEVPREAAPLLLAQRGQRMCPPKISSTTFDNTSASILSWSAKQNGSRIICIQNCMHQRLERTTILDHSPV